MTREIRYTDRKGKSLSTPKRIDHGHLGRKAAYWTLVVLVVPIALIGGAAEFVSAFLENTVGTWMPRLAVWSHPCLYGKGPRRDDD